LKSGFHWEDIDSSGNNSVMLAAAGASIEAFKIFLQFGVNIDNKNSRGHTAKDLTTED
jgi:ankyrin repeat protein